MGRVRVPTRLRFICSPTVKRRADADMMATAFRIVFLVGTSSCALLGHHLGRRGGFKVRDKDVKAVRDRLESAEEWADYHQREAERTRHLLEQLEVLASPSSTALCDSQGKLTMIRGLLALEKKKTDARGCK